MYGMTEKELSKALKAMAKAFLCSEYGELGLWSWDKGKVKFTWNKDLFMEM